MSEDGVNSVKHPSNGTDAKISDPMENEPCLTGNMKVKESFLRSKEKLLCEKTGLSKKGLYVAAIVLLILFILFLIVIVLAAVWPRIPHYYEYPVCDTPACLRAAAQVSIYLTKKNVLN